MKIEIQEELYAIRNQEGKWFRRGHRSSWRGNSWIDEFKNATIYSKASTAKSIISSFANDPYHPIPAPSLVKIKVDTVEVEDQTERTAASKKKKLEKKARENASYKEWLAIQAEKEFLAAKEKLEKLRGK